MQVAACLQDEIAQMFERLDENGDRSIGYGEFSGFMLNMDRTRTEQSLRASFDAIDTDRNGRLSLEEFTAWIVR
jgi:Ca2+-binding EF-hand superfamily protein